MSEEELRKFKKEVEDIKNNIKCDFCIKMYEEIKYWLQKLEEAIDEKNLILKHYKNSDALLNKLRKVESEEFEALENLEELIDELKKHVESH